VWDRTGARAAIRTAFAGLPCGPRAWRARYQTTAGNLVITAVEGPTIGGPARSVVVPFDVAAGLFGAARTLDEEPIVCHDSARLGSGRLYVSITSGEPGRPGRTTLRFSDDDGVRTGRQLIAARPKHPGEEPSCHGSRH
jgi:hypothetical protein